MDLISGTIDGVDVRNGR